MSIKSQGELNGEDSDQLSEFLDKLSTQVIQATKMEAKYHEEFINYSTGKYPLVKLHLDESKSIGYTFKALGAGIWALKSNFPFEEAMTQITFEAGDADTNGAVVGSLVGTRVGFRGLPARWVAKLAHRDWFVEKLKALVQAIGI